MGKYLDMAREILDRTMPDDKGDDDLLPCSTSYGELSEINTTSDWNERPACNAHVNPATRGVYEYKLTDSLSWLVLLAPGVDLNNARRTLEAQFGEDRLVEVRPKRGTCGELPCAKDL